MAGRCPRRAEGDDQTAGARRKGENALPSSGKWWTASPSFIREVINAEDLARVPDTDWVVASSMASASRERGCLYLINIRDKSWTALYGEEFKSSTGRSKGSPARKTPTIFAPHGISIRAGDEGVHTLYVINHGGRESIEVFEIDADRAKPTLKWLDSIMMPRNTWANDLVPVPGGGLLVTNMFDPEDPDVSAKMVKGEPTGHVLEWRDNGGWKDIVGSEMSGPNGIEVSKDGRWIYVAGWPTKSLVRFSRGSETKRDVIATGHLTDNLTWDSEGWILATGQDSTPQEFWLKYDHEDLVYFPFTVLRVHPDTLETQEIIRYGSDQFGTGTVAVEIKDEIWVGSSRGNKIACFRFGKN